MLIFDQYLLVLVVSSVYDVLEHYTVQDEYLVAI